MTASIIKGLHSPDCQYIQFIPPLPCSCDHPALTPEEVKARKWLKPGSSAHKALLAVVLDKLLVKHIRKLTRAMHTGPLECFHSALLKYTPKRQHFSYPVMLARTELAVMDHNANLGRDQATDKLGKPRFNVVYPKRSRTWIARPIYTPKTHEWREQLLTQVVAAKRSGTTLPQVDTSSLPTNIALDPRPPKDSVVEQYQSRFI